MWEVGSGMYNPGCMLAITGRNQNAPGSDLACLLDIVSLFPHLLGSQSLSVPPQKQLYVKQV